MHTNMFNVDVLQDGSQRSSQLADDIEKILRHIGETRKDLVFQFNQITTNEFAEQPNFDTPSRKGTESWSTPLMLRLAKSSDQLSHASSNVNYQRLSLWADTGPDVEIQILSSTTQSLHDPQELHKLATWAVDISARHEHPLPVKIITASTNDQYQNQITSICKSVGQKYPNVNIQPFIVSETIQAVVKSLECVIVGDFDTDTLSEHSRTGQRSLRTYAEIRRTSNERTNPLQSTICYVRPNDQVAHVHLGEAVQSLRDFLEISCGLHREAQALWDAFRRTIDPISRLGCNLLPQELGGDTPHYIVFRRFLDNLTFFMNANSMEITNQPHRNINIRDQPSKSVRSMNLIEKILTNSAVGLESPSVSPGQMVCVQVDWVLTSELLWGGMQKTYNRMQRPLLHRNDRIWLAVDHTVDPRTIHLPKQRSLMKDSERFRDEARIVHYLPANTSIMHTDFTREKAQPGRIVVGSDSHTCSAGSMGSFAVGFGAADTVMPMVTGETWFRVPEVCRIDFVGKLTYGVSGKDVILHILGIFKRNTIAFQRAVEYGGPGLSELSMDDRFAIANMTTEFGGMGACFEADDATAQWIARRKIPRDRRGGVYFRSDAGAEYAERKTIDLAKVQCTVGIYPNPDDVVAIQTREGMQLDGCFIGACTTAEKELVLAALVLDAGLRKGLVPVARGKRRVTPGSLVIIENLERAGLLDVYRRAGFEIGAPGCSYCVGINDVDVAAEGEVWLSSQNRNFRNRMGKGSIGNITSAAAVAASSFSMRVTDPKMLIEHIDGDKYEKLIGRPRRSNRARVPQIEEPRPVSRPPSIGKVVTPSNTRQNESLAVHELNSARRITARIQRFGTNVDTDAIIPAEFMPGIDDADLGSHCFQHYRPEFRSRAKSGAKIVVAETGFGSGSSREDAVRALKGAGIEAVIAKSFAFIYERNQLNMGLFSAVITDEEFYAYAVEGRSLTIDKTARTLVIEGHPKIFEYTHSPIEETLLEAGGILNLYGAYGRDVFRNIIAPKPSSSQKVMTKTKIADEQEVRSSGCGDERLVW